MIDPVSPAPTEARRRLDAGHLSVVEFVRAVLARVATPPAAATES